MEITEVRIKLMDADAEERLLAFCSITFENAFVVRDLKIIRGSQGPFVSMPSRKLMDRCPHCGGKNQLRAAYCNDCGAELSDDRSQKTANGKAKLYADIAHPINSHCRDQIQTSVLRAFEEEQQLARQPGYICRYEELDDMSSLETRETTSSHNDGKGGQHVRLDDAQPDRPPHAPTDVSLRHSSEQEDFGAGLLLPD